MRPQALLAQTRIELLLTVRRAESLLVTLAIPLGILVFFSKVDAVTDLSDPVDFLVPGVLALAVMLQRLSALRHGAEAQARRLLRLLLLGRHALPADPAGPRLLRLTPAMPVGQPALARRKASLAWRQETTFMKAFT